MDVTVTLGDLVSAASAILAVVGAYMRLSERMRDVEIRVGLMWQHYERRTRALDQPRGE